MAEWSSFLEDAMKRATLPLAVAGLVLSALGFQFSSSTLPSTNSAAPRITQAVDENQRVVLRGNTHPLARPQFDHGAAPSDLPLNRMLLVLKRSPEQESSLRQLLDQQQDKSSPNYHKWLTPDEFGKKFGPADQDIQVTTNWLQQHGFQIGKVARGRTVIEFSGTATQVQETFGTSIHKYVVKGKEHWANANDPQIPAALTPVVGGVFTMHDFLKKPMLKLAPQPLLAKYQPGKPLVTLGNPPIHALSPGDYSIIYNINPVYQTLNDRGGGIIAVVGRSNLFGSTQDVQEFGSVFNVPFAFPPNVVLNGPDPGDLGGGEEAEATLDTTWANAIAPSALVDLVVSASTNTTDGVDLSELYIVDNDVGAIMTESFGTCEQQPGMDSAQAYGIASLAEQAAAQGITYIVSSGDSGAEGCDDPNSSAATGPISVNVLASTPFNVAVGGTMFNENGQDSKYWASTNDPITRASALSFIPENAWNESGSNAGLWATGGGSSIFFLKPSWQPSVGAGDTMRDVPDVSLTAAGHDPYLLCLEGSCVPDAQGFISLWLVSGTSASAPSFAGIMSLVVGRMASLYGGSGRQGLANYELYQLAAQNPSTCNGSNASTPPTSNCIFNDTTLGNNAVPGESGYGTTGAKFQTAKGYDRVTGLGSVNVTNLINKWPSASYKATNTTLTVTPTTLTHGQQATVTVNVSGSGGTPTGDIGLVTSLGQSVNLCTQLGACTLTNGTFSANTYLLPGSSNPYMLSAHYAGDGTFAPSDSNIVSITVSPENSITSLQVGRGFDSFGNILPFVGGPYDSFVYLRADVAPAVAPPPPPSFATGIVNFQNGSTTLASYPLNSMAQAASPDAIYTLAPGSYSMIAQYGGDGSFNASSSTAFPTFTISKAPTLTLVSYAGAPQGASFDAVVQTSSGGASPTGNVTFQIDSIPVGTVPVSGKAAVTNPLSYIFLGAPPVQIGAQGTANLADPGLLNGQHTLVALYSGAASNDPNYLDSTSTTVAFNLQPDFTLSPPNPSKISITAPGGAGSLSFSVGALDGFTGTVNFTCSGLPAESTCNFSPTTVKGSGTTLLTVTSTPPRSSGLHRARHLQFWASAGSMAIAGMFLLGVPAGRRASRKIIGFAVFVILLAALGCGGGSSGSTAVVQHDPGTTPGTYNVTINASSGALVHRASFQLVIQ